jgi:predicted aconitase
VVALARIYGAIDLVPVKHVQIAGVSYKNLGDAGVAFLSEWAGEGARVRVPTTLNPMGMERGRRGAAAVPVWQSWGIKPEFAAPQLSVIDAFVKMGVTPTMSCTPYLLPDYAPRRGDALAWAESSAVAFANSVIGARSNREGGPSALAAAIVGRTAPWLSFGQNRLADTVVEVHCPVRWWPISALSYPVSKAVGNGVPGSRSGAMAAAAARRRHPGGPAGDRLKTLGAGLAAYGAVVSTMLRVYRGSP